MSGIVRKTEMRFVGRNIRTILVLAIGLGVSACAVLDEAEFANGQAHGALTEAELIQKTLEMLNHESTDLDVLDHDAALMSKAATELIAHRDGLDGFFGTLDDDLFETMDEVDAVKYVGPSAIAKLKTFAETWVAPIPGQVEEDPYVNVLAMLNHETTTLKVLDIDVGLTSTAAGKIIAHRDGPDGLLATADDDLFDTMDEVDDVKYVGSSTLDKIIEFGLTWSVPVPGGNTSGVDQTLLDMLNHATTSLTILDIDAGLTVTAAKHLIDHRDGTDGVFGTADDDLYDSVEEVDDVKYVGDSALALLYAYAETWTPELNDNSGPVQVPAILDFVNHPTTTTKVLTDEVGLTSTQAHNIVTYRDGPDESPGTADDNLFDSLEELDAVKYIGPVTLSKLELYAAVWIPLDPEAVLEQKVLTFINHYTTTETLLDGAVGLPSTSAGTIIVHRDGVDEEFGTADDNLFDSLAELDAVKYVGNSALDKIKLYAENWDEESAVAIYEEAMAPKPLSCELCGIFTGETTEYDPGPPAGSGWAEIFASVPNFRIVSQALGAEWLIPDENGETKLDTVNAERVLQELDPIPEYTLTKKKFRHAMGPLFYRGRLDGTARVLLVGQEGATDEALVHRAFTGGTGQKVQSFLNSIGITSSYILVNTFVYSIFEQYDEFARELAMNGPIKDHRNQILQKIFNDNDIQLVLTFGNAGYESIKTFREEYYDGAFPQGCRWSHMLHPGAAAMAYEGLGEAVEIINPGILSAVVKSFTDSWKRIWYWRYLDQGWLPTDPDGWTFQGSKFFYGDRDIPFRDLPYGATHQIGRGGTKSERAKGGLQVQLRSQYGVRYEAPTMTFPPTVSKALSGYVEAQPDEVAWEPPKYNADVRHDPGPNTSWVEYLADTPAQVVIENEAGVDTNNDFDQVPNWYRGDINGTPWLLIIAQDFGSDRVIAGRTLVGDAGQKINHFLVNIGAGVDYLMVSPYPYPLNDTVADHDVLDLSMSSSLAAYRNGLLTKVLAEKPITMVLTFGELAQSAFADVSSGYSGTWISLAHPRDASAPLSWNDGMTQLMSHPALNGLFTPYTVAGYGDQRTMIPRIDLPWGMPLWFGTSGDLSEQPDESWIFWNAPKWVNQEPAEG